MIYYDIHTHQTTVRAEDIAIISLDIINRDNLPEIFSTERNIPKMPSSRYIETNKRHEYYSVGIHPWNPDKSLISKVREYATSPTVIAIGETGLDKNSTNSTDDFKLQQELFIEHIIISEEVKKPLIIHCVKAWNELLHIRKSINPLIPWIIHGFRGKAALATQLLNAGLYLSFGAFHNTDSIKVAWEKRRLLTETDDTNTDIRDIYAQIANKLSIPVEELSGNIKVFFNTYFL